MHSHDGNALQACCWIDYIHWYRSLSHNSTRLGRNSSLVPSLDPVCKVSLLFPNVGKAGPALEDAERVADVVLLHLPAARQESHLALSLNLARPYAPLDRPEVGCAQNHAEDDDESRHGRFDRYVRR